MVGEIFFGKKGIESNEGREINKDEVLIALQKEKVPSQETRDLVLKWTLQEEAKVNKENTSRATIIFNINRADLYVAVGDIDGALECLEGARLQAHQEGEKDLYNQIMKKMDTIEGNL